MIEFKKPKRSILIALISFGAVMLLAAIAAIAFFTNKFHIEVALKGEPTITLEYGEKYTEQGATALYRGTYFMKEGKAVPLTTQGAVDTEKLGTYTLTYSAAKYGQEGKATRTVAIVDTQKPSLTLKGDEKITLTKGDDYEEPGYTAADNYDGDLTEKVTISGDLDTKTAGTYTLTYAVADSSGNAAEKKTRTITVKEAVKPPSQGSQPITVLPGEKTIYLTFDDGPGPYTAQLLDVLKKHDAKATFFVCDHSNYNHLLTRMAQEGHAIGVHTASHNYQKIYAGEDAFFADFNIVHNLIKEKTGISTTLCRFPGGSSNTVSRFNPGIMTRLAKILTERGYQYFDWNVDSFDAGGATSSAQVVNNIKRGVAGNRVSVVLQHDIKGLSVNAVEEILIWGKANGYTFKALTSSSPTAHHGINN
jgi:peptidoglycan/xylan/chitin deacetylase (PgdA/CDA1 family)